jgi:hypothetical protein
MKKVALLVGLIVLFASTSALAAPTRITFSGRLTTSSGPVTGSVNLTFRLFNAATGGTEVWTETRNGVGAQNGLVFVELGETTTLDESVFDGPRKFLEITVGTEVLTPRLPINSVPYAISSTNAAAADTLGGTIGPADVVTSVTGSQGIAATKTGNMLSVSLATASCTTGQVYKFDGTNWACQADANTTYTSGTGVDVTGTTVSLSTAGCVAGEVWKFNGTTFTCEPDVDTNTTYTGGAGITVAGTLISLSTTGCVAGEVWKFNGTTFTCEPDVDTNTTYSSGTGITVSGTTISLSTAGCVADEVWKFNGTTFTCVPDVGFNLSSCVTRTSASTALSSFFTTVAVTCNAGEIAISGGYTALNWNTSNMCIPISNNRSGTTGWSVRWGSPTATTCDAHTSSTFAVCCTP